MVRLETLSKILSLFHLPSFTFQYGQIRNVLFGTSKIINKKYLHSSMVRLETFKFFLASALNLSFTFQYGQIRNKCVYCLQQKVNEIYIPVWLDQKHTIQVETYLMPNDLHSSMVRLETQTLAQNYNENVLFTFQYGQIRNNLFYYRLQYCQNDLHSSMVRLETFIISWDA